MKETFFARVKKQIYFKNCANKEDRPRFTIFGLSSLFALCFFNQSLFRRRKSHLHSQFSILNSSKIAVRLLVYRLPGAAEIGVAEEGCHPRDLLEAEDLIGIHPEMLGNPGI